MYAFISRHTCVHTLPLSLADRSAGAGRALHASEKNRSLSIYLSICLSVYLSIYLTIYLSVYGRRPCSACSSSRSSRSRWTWGRRPPPSALDP